MQTNIKNFSLKFIDIMVGIVLGLGLQWWAELQEVWQFVAFIFVYIFIIDYWIDYGPSLKKFPPKKEIDIFLDISISFAMFFCIYATQQTFAHLLVAFGILLILDFFWLLSSKHEYNPKNSDKLFVNTWLITNVVQIIIVTITLLFHFMTTIQPLVLLVIFMALLLAARIWASTRYRSWHLAS